MIVKREVERKVQRRRRMRSKRAASGWPLWNCHAALSWTRGTVAGSPEARETLAAFAARRSLTADVARRTPPDRASRRRPESRRKAVRSATCRPAATTSRRRHNCRWKSTATAFQAARHLNRSTAFTLTPATDHMVAAVFLGGLGTGTQLISKALTDADDVGTTRR